MVVASPLFKPVAPASRLVFTMSRRIFTCVCGYIPPSVNQQYKHRKVCQDWRDRPDPRGLRIARWYESFQDYRRSQDRVLHCHICKKQVDHHSPSCPLSLSETARREAVERAGLSPNDFYLFLVALRRRYPSGVTGS